MELSPEAAERIAWGAWGLLSFIFLIVYLRWLGRKETERQAETND